MKRIIALLLVCLFLTGCTSQTVGSIKETQDPALVTSENVEFASLNDPQLLEYIEETVYSDLITDLDDNFFIENVEAVYVSQEYIDEVAYNSQSNIFFGYTLAELSEIFGDTRYVFTLDENGQTTVQAFEKYDDSYEKMLKNIAIGTGVILVCVTISAISKTAGATAISLVFASSAKTGTICALSSGVFSSVASGVLTGIETKDFNEALKTAAVDGSEAFKWGAIGGSISGGFDKTISLYGASRNGLTMNQAAKIQQESKLPLEFIKSFHSIEEYNVYKNAGLSLSKVNGKLSLTQKIDWDFIGDVEDGRTNAERVLAGLAPLDSTGKSYELHHIGQMDDSPLAILTSSQHKRNYKTLHKNTGQDLGKVDHGTAWKMQKEAFWKSLLELTQGSGL